MRPIMHAKTDSDATTSVDGASSPTRRPMYYVESPSAEMEKFSLNSSPIYSPNPLTSNHRGGYHRRSPIHHSRESSTSRFSYASLKQSYANGVGWWPMRRAVDVSDTKILVAGDEDGDDLYERDSNRKVRILSLFVVGSLIVLTIVSLILWGVSKSYRPLVSVQSIVFERFDVQAGVDETGVATEMVSLNSSVAISYVNRGAFFGVRVSSTPWEFYCYQLLVSSGEMENFYVGRKSTQTVVTLVQGHQMPVYGAVTAIRGVIKVISEQRINYRETVSLGIRPYTKHLRHEPKAQPKLCTFVTASSCATYTNYHMTSSLRKSPSSKPVKTPFDIRSPCDRNQATNRPPNSCRLQVTLSAAHIISDLKKPVSALQTSKILPSMDQMAMPKPSYREYHYVAAPGWGFC